MYIIYIFVCVCYIYHGSKVYIQNIKLAMRKFCEDIVQG